MSENNLWQMLGNARSVLNHNKIMSRESYLDRIEKVSSEDVLEIANKYLADDNLCTLIYKIPE